MREIKTDIEIAAPAAKVWDILMDFEKWGEWNPIVKEASGSAEMGAKLSVTMLGPDGKVGQKYDPAITELSAPRQFRWRAHMLAGFLFTNDKVFELEETVEGTKLTHIEAFSGLMTPLFWGKMKSFVPTMLDSMNAAVKLRAEQSTEQ